MADKSRYHTVSIMRNDYEFFDTIRKDWIKQHGAKIFMPQMLKIAMEAFKDNDHEGTH